MWMRFRLIVSERSGTLRIVHITGVRRIATTELSHILNSLHRRDRAVHTCFWYVTLRISSLPTNISCPKASSKSGKMEQPPDSPATELIAVQKQENHRCRRCRHAAVST